MNNFSIKLNRILLPYIFIAVGCVAGYTLLFWILMIRAHVLKVDEEVTNLWIPMALPWIPMLIWLKPGLKLLNLRNRKGSYIALYYFVGGVPIVIASITANSYLIKATGKLTPLKDIGEIALKPQTKYYTATNYYADKNLGSVKSSFSVSGKYNENFDMTLYFVCPLYGNNMDTAKMPPPVVSPGSGHAAQPAGQPPHFDGNRAYIPAAWAGVKYYKSISNRSNKDEKEAKYKAFYEESLAGFKNTDFQKAAYFDRVGLSDRLKGYQGAVARIYKDQANLPGVILEEQTGAFADRMGNSFQWIFMTLAIGAAVFLLIIAIRPFANEDIIAADISESAGDKEAFGSIILPKPGYFITPLIIDLNLLIFILMVCSGMGLISFNGADLMKWGANYRPVTMQGQWWRLLTNTYLHGGLMHVLFNMYGLMFVGMLLEPRLGKNRFLLIYLLTGIIASAASIWWHPATVSVGASGAIFGLYGTFFALLTTNIFPKELKKSFLISTSFFIGYNLLFGLIGGIDNAAHIGGLLSGLLIGYLVYPSLKSEPEPVLENDSQSLYS